MPRDGDPGGEAGADLRQRLRARTAAAHARLDRAIDAACLGDPPDLPRLLLLHLAALRQVVPALDRVGAGRLLPGWEGGSRLAALVADLATLGLDPPPSRPADLVLAAGPEAWGALYALEGSRLGNRVLLQRLGPQAGEATRFLRHRPAAEADWPRLVARLTALDLQGAGFEAACRGAGQVFAAYLDALELPAGWSKPGSGLIT